MVRIPNVVVTLSVSLPFTQTVTLILYKLGVSSDHKAGRAMVIVCTNSLLPLATFFIGVSTVCTTSSVGEHIVILSFTFALIFDWLSNVEATFITAISSIIFSVVTYTPLCAI